jgi:probable HAF family extracellular repeat protein
MKLKAVSNWVVASVIGFASVLPSAPAAAAPQMTDLGTLGGPTSNATDVNESGQIVGSATLANAQTHAFIITPWLGPQMIDLGTLPNGTFSEARAISNRGQVVGGAFPEPGTGISRAFLWDQGVMTALPDLAGSDSSWANDVNDAGVIVGASGFRPVRWVNGVPQQLGPISGLQVGGEAVGINASGVIVGHSPDPSGVQRGWVFQNGVFTVLSLFGGRGMHMTGINSSGDLTGIWNPPVGFIQRGFVIKGGVFTLLGPANTFSSAQGISDSGLIVGSIGDFNNATLWDYNRNAVELAPATSIGLGVNSGGIIVGQATVNGQSHAVRWRFP